MHARLDHLILPVNELEAHIDFYTGILGFENEGEQEPFTLLRIDPDCLLLLAPWGSPGGRHMAFSMPRSEFDEIYGRVKAAEIPYGDSFETVGNMQGPGVADGAHGPTTSLYFMDPGQNLIEILHYES